MLLPLFLLNRYFFFFLVARWSLLFDLAESIQIGYKRRNIEIMAMCSYVLVVNLAGFFCFFLVYDPLFLLILSKI